MLVERDQRGFGRANGRIIGQAERAGDCIVCRGLDSSNEFTDNRQ
jgi:hypothetical protein